MFLRSSSLPDPQSKNFSSRILSIQSEKASACRGGKKGNCACINAQQPYKMTNSNPILDRIEVKCHENSDFSLVNLFIFDYQLILSLLSSMLKYLFKAKSKQEVWHFIFTERWNTRTCHISGSSRESSRWKTRSPSHGFPLLVQCLAVAGLHFRNTESQSQPCRSRVLRVYAMGHHSEGERSFPQFHHFFYPIEETF